jgi:hexosaminidase
MMWGYMTNVGKYFPENYYEKYGRIFGSIWVASAYKGAQGELATVTKMQDRLSNHLSWIQVMKEKSDQSILQFEGIALTGWSRYDHFLALCDLLPQAIPQLVSLIL